MSEIKRWATEFLDAVDGQDVGFWMRSLARAILADTSPAKGVYFPDINLGSRPPNYIVDPDGTTKELGAGASPASQERDEDGLLGALIGVSGRDLQHQDGPCWCPEGRGGSGHTVACERAHAAVLARLRSGSEPGERPDLDSDDDFSDGPEPLPWDGEWGIPELSDDDAPAARPSGGEGAPEPDDRAILRRLYGAAIGNAGVYPTAGWTDRVTEDYRYLLDRLPPERDACSTCTEGQPPYFCRECVHKREEGLRGALEREAEAEVRGRWTGWVPMTAAGPKWGAFSKDYRKAKAAADGIRPVRRVYLDLPDREAEIRTDERRTIREKVKALKYGDGGHQHNIWDAALDRVINRVVPVEARLSPTDEQESPNRSDEP